ncbi:vWA domain-containing protein [Phaeocystidibacter luteus]|uniref:VWA domain-containing protein n=1 Tax=Phaeocystidibacter luteus TaxID=911197 RepID=A0A6N6RFS9_9FLAO|nr:VWA domain-containing protein [Phaeocystidibacter luteus]KAB2808598.1 VWA domain-containing protein [Phaeocystidibacter luteus]
MNLFEGTTFANPEWLWGLILIPIMGVGMMLRSQTGTVRFSHFESGGFTWANLRPWTSLLSLIGLACWIVAFARPQSSQQTQQIRGGEGIDIFLAVDVSYSMEALDLKPTRLEALKVVANEFVKNRPNDRIGLVVYAGEAYTQVPLTTDHEVLTSAVKSLNSDLLEPGTAVGMGLSTALSRIKDSEAESKVVILMTDGENNRGEIDPRSAARLARELGVRVYTIGIGTKGYAMMPTRIMNGRKMLQRVKVNIDEDLLREIADATEGRYFRAQNKEQLADIYQEIDRLEKSKIEELKFVQYDEHFYPWALAGLLFIAAEFTLKNTLFRSVV